MTDELLNDIDEVITIVDGMYANGRLDPSDENDQILIEMLFGGFVAVVRVNTPSLTAVTAHERVAEYVESVAPEWIKEVLNW